MLTGKNQIRIYKLIQSHKMVTIRDFMMYYSTKYKAKEQLNHFVMMGFLKRDIEHPEQFKYTGLTMEEFNGEMEIL